MTGTPAVCASDAERERVVALLRDHAAEGRLTLEELAERVEVDFRGLAIGGHTRANGNDPPARPGTPLVRVASLSIFAGLDVWRVPVEWRDRTWREVIKDIRRGENRELEE